MTSIPLWFAAHGVVALSGYHKHGHVLLAATPARSNVMEPTPVIPVVESGAYPGYAAVGGFAPVPAPAPVAVAYQEPAQPAYTEPEPAYVEPAYVEPTPAPAPAAAAEEVRADGRLMADSFDGRLMAD